jgi:hypothetical protein
MPPKILWLSIFLLITSCVKDVDFDQSDDLSIQPKYVASLVHFTISQDKFIDDLGNELIKISENFSTPINTSTIANENITKAEIQFKTSNSFNRIFIIVIKLYDIDGNVTFSFNPITLNPNTSNIPQKQTIQGADLNNFVRSNSATMEVILLPSTNGSVIDANIAKSINVQVSGLFYLNFNF